MYIYRRCYNIPFISSRKIHGNMVFSFSFFYYLQKALVGWQTIQTLIRLLLQSDLGVDWLPRLFCHLAVSIFRTFPVLSLQCHIFVVIQFLHLMLFIFTFFFVESSNLGMENISSTCSLPTLLNMFHFYASPKQQCTVHNLQN